MPCIVEVYWCDVLSYSSLLRPSWCPPDAANAARGATDGHTALPGRGAWRVRARRVECRRGAGACRFLLLGLTWRSSPDLTIFFVAFEAEVGIRL